MSDNLLFVVLVGQHAAPMISSSCASEVALAIGAVMFGRAMGDDQLAIDSGGPTSSYDETPIEVSREFANRTLNLVAVARIYQTQFDRHCGRHPLNGRPLRYQQSETPRLA
jgi:hypothetical protein